MEQPDPVNAKAREYVALQLGDQVLRMCEMQARLDVQAQQMEALTRALDAARAQNAGSE